MYNKGLPDLPPLPIMDPLPSFGDLLSSLSLSENADHSLSETSNVVTRPRSLSNSSLSSLASSSLRTRTSSTTSNMADDQLSSPPPDISDISSIVETPTRSMRLAKSRSVGRLRGSRYAPYQDCSRRPSLPCLPNVSVQPPSPAKIPVNTENRPLRTRHSRSRSGNTDSHPSSPISLYARRGHSRTSSLKSIHYSGQAPHSPTFEPPRLPTVPCIQPFNNQVIPQRSPRMPLAPLDSPMYPRQIGLRISGLLNSSSTTPARYICA